VRRRDGGARVPVLTSADDRNVAYSGHGFGATSRAPILTGESDECPQQLPSQYLVVRGLDASVTEQVLADGIAKLFVEKAEVTTGPQPSLPAHKLKSTAPIGNTSGLGAKPGSLRRVFLMRDTFSGKSWRYGFAEFATLEDALAAVTKFRASAKFTIANAPAVVAFIHTGVFVPAGTPSPMADPRIPFAPVYNSQINLRYWDDRVYPSVWDVNVPHDTGPPSPDRASSPDKMENAGSAKRGRKAKEKPKDSALVMAPQMQMWAKKSAELHGRPPRVQGDEKVLETLSERPKTGPRAARPSDASTSYADWDSLQCLLCDVGFETTQALRDHENLTEAHAVALSDEDKRSEAVAKLALLDKHPEVVIRRRPRDRSEPAPVYISYADVDGLRCLVCERKFKAAGILRLHERESELHRKRMTNEKNVERAVAELAAAGQQPTRMRPAPPNRDRPERYRDRARERRVQFNQPGKPGAPPPAKARARRDKPDEAAPKKAAGPSKGASLLNKMGWTAGQGLGAEGTGRTEAIATDLYAPGVGLGAEGGRVGDAAEEAAKKTGGTYASFVQDTKDKARARFEKLG